MLAAGDRAPLFVAPGTDGDIDLGAMLREGPVVLYFFPRALTSGCTVEAREFNQLLPEFAALGVKVAGISVDPVARLQKFRDELDLKFPLVSDLDRAIGALYGTLKGDLTTSHERDTVLVGKDVTILVAYQGVSAQGHAAAVLAEAKSLHDQGDL